MINTVYKGDMYRTSKKHIASRWACLLISVCWLRKALSVILVGGFNPSEKYESQLG